MHFLHLPYRSYVPVTLSRKYLDKNFFCRMKFVFLYAFKLKVALIEMLYYASRNIPLA